MINRLKTYFLFSLTLVLLLMSNTTEAAPFSVVENQQKKENFLGKDSIHAEDFIQPQADFSVCSNRLDYHHNARFFSPPLVYFLYPKTEKLFSKSFFSQDINRCESVSLLLFPHHHFW